MAGSISPRPSFHLCPDFSIAPPPDGHIQLGSVLRALDIDGVLAPLDIGATVPIPASQLLKPTEKAGFSRSLKELRSLDGSIWARLFGWDGLGALFSFLRKRENDEILTVEKLFVQYFVPTPEYMDQALNVDGVSFYVNNNKFKKPVYLVTGLMWTEGAKLSKNQSNNKMISGRAATTDPHSGFTGGSSEAYETENSLATSFNGSTPFILGIRVRKMSWDKQNIRHDTYDVIGATLSESKTKNMDMSEGLKWADDDEADAITGQIIASEAKLGEVDPVTWVWP
ncbi:hypothetical protein TWF281_011411 [Arthrobotrys megalospora]